MARASDSKSKSASAEVMDVDITEGEAQDTVQDAEKVDGLVEDHEGDDDDEEEEEEEEGEYEVEKVLDHKQKAVSTVQPDGLLLSFRANTSVRNGPTLSRPISDVADLVAWKGYGAEHNTWEPEAHVSVCLRH